MNSISIGNRKVGVGHPCFIIAEIGINHNGSVDTAKKLIDVAVDAGCDAVKFQKRTPELCVPSQQRDILRETPWGIIKYIDYKKRIEFDIDEYEEIDDYCNKKKIIWFASCWDMPSIEFLEQFKPCCYKIASASLTDDALLNKLAKTNVPLILSTGMSTMTEIEHAVSLLPEDKLLLAQATSTYPCLHEEINLKFMDTLKQKFDCPIGYSGHEVGLQISLAAVAIGASFIERHITLDRAMWGSDHAASLETSGLKKLVRDIRIVEKAMGNGIKQVYDSELPIRQKLRNS